ncbi:MAG: hypothetical protein A2044_01620 [Candidatus Firestonebacteria bacterium GWA2_43_8]|nr:MAG: hypothetical protein A2044_01620 [Candidatus Firestonebacteria bacterium GWA2_43_8]
MRKLCVVMLVLFTASVVLADGGTFQKKRVTRFTSSPDNVGADIPDNVKAWIPAEAKSKTVTFVDIQMYKMAELEYMLPVKGIKEPASVYTKVCGRVVMVGSEYGEMMIKMQLDGASTSRRKELVNELKEQFESTEGEGMFRMRKFYEAEAVSSKKFPGTNVWVQKWETEDDSPKQTWYDCFYIQKGAANVVELRVYAAPSFEAADKLFAGFLAKVNKK